jgi:hypothetical protein
VLRGVPTVTAPISCSSPSPSATGHTLLAGLIQGTRRSFRSHVWNVYRAGTWFGKGGSRNIDQTACRGRQGSRGFEHGIRSPKEPYRAGPRRRFSGSSTRGLGVSGEPGMRWKTCCPGPVLVSSLECLITLVLIPFRTASPQDCMGVGVWLSGLLE